MNVELWYTRVFEGPLHERCYRLWAERVPQARVLHNTEGWDHERCLREIWERADPQRHLIITEADFLPDHTIVETIMDAIGAGAALVAPDYLTRDHGPPHHIRTWPYTCGAWLLAFNRDFWGTEPPSFEGLDPGNELWRQLQRWGGKAHVLRAHDDFTCGVRYPDCGRHLFWSRHWNDAPGGWAAGFSLDVIRAGAEHALTRAEAGGTSLDALSTGWGVLL